MLDGLDFASVFVSIDLRIELSKNVTSVECELEEEVVVVWRFVVNSMWRFA